MSTFSPEIKIENGKYKFNFGEIVKGQVLIDVKEEIEIKEIKLNLIFFIKGKGDSYKTIISENFLNKDCFLKKGKYFYDFEIKLPSEKKYNKTYSGKIFSINWKLQLHVNVKKNKLKNLFESKKCDEFIKINEIKDTKKVVSHRKYEKKRTSIVSMLFANLIIFIIVFIVSLNLDNYFDYRVILWIATALIAILDFVILRNNQKIKRRKNLFSENKLEVLEEFSEELNLNLKLKAKKTVNIKNIKANLRILEYAEEEICSEIRKYKNQLFNVTLEQEPLKLLKIGEEKTFNFTYKLNENFPQTLRIRSTNSITWYFKLEMNGKEFDTYELRVM